LIAEKNKKAPDFLAPFLFSYLVIARLVRAIQFVSLRKMDGPHKAGHDGGQR